MNQVKLELNREDIETAIIEYLRKKYPNFKPDSMHLEYNRRKHYGKVTGYLK